MSEILDRAKKLGIIAEYVWRGQGEDKDNDGKLDYDCSGLVLDTLNKLGYVIPDMSALEMAGSGFFDIIPADQVQEGDIIVTTNHLGGGHTGIVEQYDPATGTGKFYGAQSSTTGIGTRDFGSNTYWKRECIFLRPKAEYRIGDALWDIMDAILRQAWSEVILKIRSIFTAGAKQGSPIILDLDKDGVETTALSNGTYFDHDANGFSEQTGWVNSDDGLLVLDRNSDGQINNGSELFGNNTLLANGTNAANGFSATADSLRRAGISSFRLQAISR